jgi:hypothetical protein
MGNFHHGSVLFRALGVHRTEAQERLAASLGASDQKMPIVVVATGQAGRGLVIEGHPRIGTLELLDRDTVDAVTWRLSNAKALLLDRPSSWGRTGHRARTRRSNKALEQGWLLVEPEQRFGYGLKELARCSDRSTSWVSRRGLAEQLRGSRQPPKVYFWSMRPSDFLPSKGSMLLEVLNFALVLFGLLQSRKCAEIATFSG